MGDETVALGLPSDLIGDAYGLLEHIGGRKDAAELLSGGLPSETVSALAVASLIVIDVVFSDLQRASISYRTRCSRHGHTKPGAAAMATPNQVQPPWTSISSDFLTEPGVATMATPSPWKLLLLRFPPWPRRLLLLLLLQFPLIAVCSIC
ncbi:hypothetical protein U1Q18_003100 [Sarracenia purpurea var. burkii]